MIKEKLLHQVRYVIRVKHLSYRTEEVYLNWIKKFILFHNKRHPIEMRETDVSQFLTYLAVNKRVASSTQNQALSAILFLYRDVLKKELSWLDDVDEQKDLQDCLWFLQKNETGIPDSIVGTGSTVTQKRYHN